MSQKEISLSERVANVVTRTTEDFGKNLKKEFYEVKTGDFSPESHQALVTALWGATQSWIKQNTTYYEVHEKNEQLKATIIDCKEKK